MHVRHWEGVRQPHQLLRTFTATATFTFTFTFTGTHGNEHVHGDGVRTLGGLGRSGEAAESPQYGGPGFAWTA